MTQAVTLNPQDADAYCERARAYEQSGQREKAVADCIKAMRLDPKKASVFRDIGDEYIGSGDNIDDVAFAYYTLALEVDPRDRQAYFGRGTIRHWRGEYDEAVRDFEEEICIDPEHAESHYGLAKALVYHEMYEDAIYHYDEAIRLDPPDAEAIQLDR